VTRRPRTSTLVLIGLFLGVLALYVAVRPDPGTTTGTARQTGNTGTAPAGGAPSPTYRPPSPGPSRSSGPSPAASPSRTAGPSRSGRPSPSGTPPSGTTPAPTLTPASGQPASSPPAPASSTGPASSAGPGAATSAPAGSG
jgi:hypothetical protein